MELPKSQNTQGTKMTFDPVKFPQVDVSRKFNAPVERIWKAWTDAELIKQWWGPETYTCPSATVDVRPGGKSVMAMKAPDGQVTYSGGEYLEVIPNKKIVSTDTFMDQNGNPISPKAAGMPGVWADTMKVTIDFNKISENESEIHIAHDGIPKDQHDDCVKGWTSSLVKLQRLVEHS